MVTLMGAGVAMLIAAATVAAPPVPAPSGAMIAVQCLDPCDGWGYDRRGRYGALAYGPQSGAHGWSYDYGNADAARARAFAECLVHARDCQIVASFYGGCGAVAAAQDGTVTWGHSATRLGAEIAAQRHCQQQATGCEVKVWACSWR